MKLLFLSNYAHIVMPVSSMLWHAHHTLCDAQSMCYMLHSVIFLPCCSWDVSNYRFLIPILKGSNTLNNTGVWSLIELASLYTVPLSAVNGLSRLTTTSNGQTRPIRKFSNRLITVESNRIGTADSNSNRISKLRRSLCLNHHRCKQRSNKNFKNVKKR